tara:strand:+ start:211 stop:420 length:210 start_codon:yes stop_codon:yes gene_type:complete
MKMYNIYLKRNVDLNAYDDEYMATTNKPNKFIDNFNDDRDREDRLPYSEFVVKEINAIIYDEETENESR